MGKNQGKLDSHVILPRAEPGKLRAEHTLLWTSQEAAAGAFPSGREELRCQTAKGHREPSQGFLATASNTGPLTPAKFLLLKPELGKPSDP